MRFLTLIFGLSISMTISGQSTNTDDLLLVRYSESELIELKTKNPNLYAYWSFYAQQRGEIISIPDGKEVADLREVEFDTQRPNFLLLDLEDIRVHGGFMRVKGSAMLLRIRPESEFTDLFNSQSER